MLMLMVRSGNDAQRLYRQFGFGFALGGVLIICAVFWPERVVDGRAGSVRIQQASIDGLHPLDGAGHLEGGFDMNSTCDASHGSIGSSISTGLFTCFISPMMVLFPSLLPELMDITVIVPTFDRGGDGIPRTLPRVAF
jgi:hypothetical protein